MLEYFTVHRNDETYCSFPDLVRTEAGKLICVFREADDHRAQNFSRIALIESEDGGKTWAKKRILSDGKMDIPDSTFVWNCPRISLLSGNRLVITCDIHKSREHRLAVNNHKASSVYYWISSDGGESWTEPINTKAIGIVPGRMLEASDGSWLFCTHYESRIGKLVEVVYRSEDQGVTWEAPIVAAENPEYNLNEGTMLSYETTLIMYLRENSNLGYPGFKVFSYDAGKTWVDLCKNQLLGCHRPVPGILKSGKILTTYRMHNGKGKVNFMAGLETMSSAFAVKFQDQHQYIMQLDHDNNKSPDTGYSGWVQLEDESIYCIYYIKKESDKAFIKGVRFSEDDIHIYD